MKLINYNDKGYCMPGKYTDCEQTVSLTHEEFEHFSIPDKPEVSR